MKRRGQIMTLVHELVQEPKAVVGLIVFGIFLFISVFAPLLANHNPTQPIGPLWQAPNIHYWFGTTNEGQDVYSQWIYGTRTSMLIGLCVGVITTVISVLIGIYSGYKGGAVDTFLNWFTNVMLVIPSFPLMLVVASYIPNAGTQAIIWVLGLTSWPSGARMKRAQAMTFKGRDFILAAKMTGMSDFEIVVREIIPNMISLIFNTFINGTSWGIFGEAFLRFLGIGSTNAPSWGNMLNWSQNSEALMNGGWWWFIPPGLSMTIVILSLTLINYGVDTISNPRLKNPPKLSKEWQKKLEVSAR